VLAVGEDGFTVATADGSINIMSVQPAGNKKLPALEFSKIAGLKSGDLLGN
jgi:methionyl-tRNA formyltransferase